MSLIGLLAQFTVQPDFRLAISEIPFQVEAAGTVAGNDILGVLATDSHAKEAFVRKGFGFVAAIPFGGGSGVSGRNQGEQQARGNQGFHGDLSFLLTGV